MAQGLVVPSAAVWMAETPRNSDTKVVNVRTLADSNSGRVQPLRNSQIGRPYPPIYLPRHVANSPQDLEQKPVVDPHGRSIKENLKQWAGGGIFGLVVFVCLIWSQAGEEEIAPTFPEAQMVGVSLGE